MYEVSIPRSSAAISRTQLATLELILWVSFTAPLVLLQLPYESIDGNPVPTVIFKGLPLTFQCFIVSLTLAFTGAFSALMIYDCRSQFTTAFRYLSMASMASAVIFLAWALTVKWLNPSLLPQDLVSLHF